MKFWKAGAKPRGAAPLGDGDGGIIPESVLGAAEWG